MARSKNFGTKRIRTGSSRAKEITRFIDERRGRSAVTGRYVTSSPAKSSGGKTRREER